MAKTLIQLTLILTIAILTQKGDFRPVSRSAKGYKNCCGIKKSIETRDHSACKAPSDDFVRSISVNKTEVLNFHLACRDDVKPRASNMAKMVWDETLACIAQQYAKQCENDRDNEEQRAYPTAYPLGVGQNTALTWGYYSFEEIVQAWCDEQSNWEYGSGQLLPNDDMPIDHFIQIVSAKTTAVGCGAAKCRKNGKIVYVCNYGAAGTAETKADPKKYPYEI